jgi:hypothetical protein
MSHRNYTTTLTVPSSGTVSDVANISGLSAIGIQAPVVSSCQLFVQVGAGETAPSSASFVQLAVQQTANSGQIIPWVWPTSGRGLEKEWPLDLMGACTGSMQIDGKLRHAILNTELSTEAEPAISEPPQGDDYQLKYYDDGYAKIPACLRRITGYFSAASLIRTCWASASFRAEITVIGLRAARIKMVPVDKSIISHAWRQVIDVIYGPVFNHLFAQSGGYYL